MPCYERPTDEEVAADRKAIRDGHMAEFMHNSPLAEWLCGIMTVLDEFKSFNLSDTDDEPEIRKWWSQHKARDVARGAPSHGQTADDSDERNELLEEGEEEYSLAQAVRLAYLWKGGKLVGGSPENVISALLREVKKHHVVGGGGQLDPIGTGTPMPPEMAGAERDEDGDLLVNLGDLSNFGLEDLKKLMAGGVDNNHEGMVEEHIKVFNYAVVQGMHSGQALLAIIQAAGSLMGFAIRSGMDAKVAAAMTALIMRTTQDAANQVRIVTTN